MTIALSTQEVARQITERLPNKDARDSILSGETKGEIIC